MRNRSFHANSLIAQGLRDPLEILLPGFHFRRGGLLSVHLAGDAFLHVQQVHAGAVELGHGGGVADGQAVELGVVERHQDPLVDGAPADFGAGRLRQGHRRPAVVARAARSTARQVTQTSRSSDTEALPERSTSPRPASSSVPPLPASRQSPMTASRMFRPMMIAAVVQARTRTQSALANAPMRCRSLVKWISGITANGSCMLRITWLRISSLIGRLSRRRY